MNYFFFILWEEQERERGWRWSRGRVGYETKGEETIEKERERGKGKGKEIGEMKETKGKN